MPLNAVVWKPHIAWLLQPSGTLLHGIGTVAWPLLHFNFGRPYLSRLNSDSCVLELYEKLFKSRIWLYASD